MHTCIVYKRKFLGILFFFSFCKRADFGWLDVSGKLGSQPFLSGVELLSFEIYEKPFKMRGKILA